MLNFIWAGMIVIGIVFAAFTGQMAAVTTAALDSAKEAVSLCITMLGVMSFWVGMMEIAKESGMIESLQRKMEPILTWLFPRIPQGHPAREHIAVNMVANILGLGWAATPAGLKAMEELKKISKMKSGVASVEMCNFLIFNISSLQLIPVNVLAYRSQYGSANPSAVIGPAIFATMISTAAAVIFCKIMEGRKK